MEFHEEKRPVYDLQGARAPGAGFSIPAIVEVLDTSLTMNMNSSLTKSLTVNGVREEGWS